MLLSAVSVLVVAQSSSEIPEGLMNNPVYQKVSDATGEVFHKQMSGFHCSCDDREFLHHLDDT